jgi:hypothetical protein
MSWQRHRGVGVGGNGMEGKVRTGRRGKELAPVSRFLKTPLSDVISVAGKSNANRKLRHTSVQCLIFVKKKKNSEVVPRGKFDTKFSGVAATIQTLSKFLNSVGRFSI